MYEALDRYLSSLPDGADSYPDCVSQDWGFEKLRQQLPHTEPDRVPPQLLDYLHGWDDSKFVPEVFVSAVLELWFHSVGEAKDETFRHAIRGHHFRLVRSTLGPRLLGIDRSAPKHTYRDGILGLSRSWGVLHTGTTVSATLSPQLVAPQTASIVVTHPPSLFSERMLMALEEYFAPGPADRRDGSPRFQVSSREAEATTLEGSWRP